jgi:hypothetical protein
MEDEALKALRFTLDLLEVAIAELAPHDIHKLRALARSLRSEETDEATIERCYALELLLFMSFNSPGNRATALTIINGDGDTSDDALDAAGRVH